MYVVIAVILIAIAWLLIRWFRHQSRQKKIQYLLVVIIVALLVLAASGRLHWFAGAIGTIFGLLALLLKKLWLWRWLFRLRKNTQGQQGPAGLKVPPTMSRDEALKILGLDSTASRQQIIDAHKKLIQRNHPDRGGSSFLTQQINQAKKALLGE